MVGEELGSYRVLRPIGKGGMASVYVGEHMVLGHRVAIKVLHPKHLSNPSIERRFFNEAQAIAKIRHPSVVQIFDFGRAGPDNLAYIVMEYLEGETLRSRIRSGVMSEREVVAFGRQVASGLAAAHEAGIIHRDLKPDNVFLIHDHEVELGERAKVLDFGIAKQVDLEGPVPEHTAAGILVGTPAYMSPEQCRGHGVIDHRADIYSLGVVLYRMATNQLPFEAAGTGELIGKHLYIAAKSPVELNPEISAPLSEVILRCLAKEPADRFQSMEELAAALRASITPSSRLATQPPLTPVPPASHPPVESRPQVTSPPVPDEDTHPTTLRTASGEAAPHQAVPLRSKRTMLYAALAALALAAIVLIATVPRGRGPHPAAAGQAPEQSGASESAAPESGEAKAQPAIEPAETAGKPSEAAAATGEPSAAKEEGTARSDDGRPASASSSDPALGSTDPGSTGKPGAGSASHAASSGSASASSSDRTSSPASASAKDTESDSASKADPAAASRSSSAGREHDDKERHHHRHHQEGKRPADKRKRDPFETKAVF